MTKILYPFGDADHQSPVYAATIALDVYDRKTIVEMPVLTGVATIDLTIDPEIRDGSELVINVDQGATGRTVTFGAGFVGDALVGVANDKDTVTAIYSSVLGAFRIASVYKTVDAA